MKSSFPIAYQSVESCCNIARHVNQGRSSINSLVFPFPVSEMTTKLPEVLTAFTLLADASELLTARESRLRVQYV